MILPVPIAWSRRQWLKPCASIAESPLGITVSIGTSAQVCPDGGTLPEALVARADRALCKAKNAGRNQVKVCADC